MQESRIASISGGFVVAVMVACLFVSAALGDTGSSHRNVDDNVQDLASGTTGAGIPWTLTEHQKGGDDCFTLNSAGTMCVARGPVSRRNPPTMITGIGSTRILAVVIAPSKSKSATLRWDHGLRITRVVSPIARSSTGHAIFVAEPPKKSQAGPTVSVQ